jgi:hypothetical protein
MKTDQLLDQDPAPSFPKIVSIALGRLKKRLQRHYQKAYPESGEIINLVLDEEEANAQQISFFPHLIFPDLVDVHVAKLGLQPGETPRDTAYPPRDFTTTRIPKTAFALCG